MKQIKILNNLSNFNHMLRKIATFFHKFYFADAYALINQNLCRSWSVAIQNLCNRYSADLEGLENKNAWVYYFKMPNEENGSLCIDDKRLHRLTAQYGFI